MVDARSETGARRGRGRASGSRRMLCIVVAVAVGAVAMLLVLVLTRDGGELRDGPIDVSTGSPPPGDAEALRRDALGIADNAIRRIGRDPREYNLRAYGYDIFGKKGWWFSFSRKKRRPYDGGDNEMDVLVLPDGSVSINGGPMEDLGAP